MTDINCDNEVAEALNNIISIVEVGLSEDIKFQHLSDLTKSDKQERNVFSTETTKSFNKSSTTTEEVAQYLIDLSNENKKDAGKTVGLLAGKKNVSLASDMTESNVEFQEYSNNSPVLSIASKCSLLSPTSTSSLLASKEPLVKVSTTAHSLSSESTGNAPIVSKSNNVTRKNPFTTHGDTLSLKPGGPNNSSLVETFVPKKLGINTIKNKNTARSPQSGSNVLPKMSVDDIAMKLHTSITSPTTPTAVKPVTTLSASDSKLSASMSSPMTTKEAQKQEHNIPDISSFLRKEMMKILPDMLQKLYPSTSGDAKTTSGCSPEVLKSRLELPKVDALPAFNTTFTSTIISNTTTILSKTQEKYSSNTSPTSPKGKISISQNSIKQVQLLQNTKQPEQSLSELNITHNTSPISLNSKNSVQITKHQEESSTQGSIISDPSQMKLSQNRKQPSKRKTTSINRKMAIKKGSSTISVQTANQSLSTPMIISVPNNQGNEYGVLSVNQIQKEMEKYIPMPILVQQNMSKFQPIQPQPLLLVDGAKPISNAKPKTAEAIVSTVMMDCLARNKHNFKIDTKNNHAGNEMFEFPITNPKDMSERSFLNPKAHIDSIDDVEIINGRRFFKVKRSFYSLEEESDDHRIFIESAPKLLKKMMKAASVQTRIILGTGRIKSKQATELEIISKSEKRVSLNSVENTDNSDQGTLNCDLNISKINEPTSTKKRKLCINVNEINNNTEPSAKQLKSYSSETDGPLFLPDAIRRQKRMDLKPLFLKVNEECSGPTQPCKEFDFASTLSKARVSSKIAQQHGIEGQCRHCNRTFYGSIKIKAHQGIYSRYKCPRCLLQICNQKKLYAHIKTHVNFKYQCFKCLKQFDKFEARKTHQKSAHPNEKSFNLKKPTSKEWRCVLCQKRFPTFMAACKHRTKFCKKRNDQGCCNICNKMFSDKNKLMSHIRLHNLEVKKEHEKPKRNMRKLVCSKLIKKKYLKIISTKKAHCQTCVGGFKHCEAFYEHVNQRKCIYLKNTLVCTICRKSFDSMGKLEDHVRLCFRETLVSLLRPGKKKTSTTSESEKDEPVKMVYHCRKCGDKSIGKIFPSKVIFQKHNGLYHKKNKEHKAYECNKCFFQCHSESLLRKHLKERRCPKMDDYQCYLCNPNEKNQATFKSVRSLLKHLRTHKNVQKNVEKNDSTSKVIPAEIVENDGEVKKLLTFTCFDAKRLVGNYQFVSQGSNSYIVTVVKEALDYRVVAVPKYITEQKFVDSKASKLIETAASQQLRPEKKQKKSTSAKADNYPENYKTKVWHCVICDTIYKSSAKVKFHYVTRNHGSSSSSGLKYFYNWKCCFCLKECPEPFEHAKQHTETMFECYICYVRVSSLSSMKSHFQSKHHTISDEDLCFYNTLQETAVWKTVQTMFKNRKPKSKLSNTHDKAVADKFICKRCNICFMYTETLERHKEMGTCKKWTESTPEPLKSPPPKKNVSKSFPFKTRSSSQESQESQVSSTDDNGTWSDLQRQGQTMLFKCPVCHCLTSERLKMMKHISSRHEDSIVIRESDPIVVIVDQENLQSCKDCHLLYGEKEAALICQLSHVGIEVETCNICLDTFPTKTALLHHLLGFHHTMFCHLCHKGFHTYEGLVTHCQLHVHETLIPRDANGKMVIEIGIHNGKTFLFQNQNESNAEKFCISSKIPPAVIADSRLFYCILCQQNIEGELTHIVHMKTHELKRPLSCLKCQEQFITDSDLKKHYKGNNKCKLKMISYDQRVTGRPSCICFVCLLVFEDNKALYKHECEHGRYQNPLLLKKSLKVMNSLQCFLNKVPNVVEVKQTIEWPADLKNADQIYGLKKLVEDIKVQPVNHNWSCCKKSVVDKNCALNCPFCFVPNKMIERHLLSHNDTHNMTQIKCCTYVFSTYDDLLVHVEKVHKPRDDVRYFCPYCFVPVGLSHLKRHHYGISFHSNKIRCSYCCMVFNKKEFKQHLADKNPNANLSKTCSCPSYKTSNELTTSLTKSGSGNAKGAAKGNQFKQIKKIKKEVRRDQQDERPYSNASVDCWTPTPHISPNDVVSSPTIETCSQLVEADDFTVKIPGTSKFTLKTQYKIDGTIVEEAPTAKIRKCTKKQKVGKNNSSNTSFIKSTRKTDSILVKAKEKRRNLPEMLVAKYNKMKTSSSSAANANANGRKAVITNKNGKVKASALIFAAKDPQNTTAGAGKQEKATDKNKIKKLAKSESKSTKNQNEDAGTFSIDQNQLEEKSPLDHNTKPNCVDVSTTFKGKTVTGNINNNNKKTAKAAQTKRVAEKKTPGKLTAKEKTGKKSTPNKMSTESKKSNAEIKTNVNKLTPSLEASPPMFVDSTKKGRAKKKENAPTQTPLKEETPPHSLAATSPAIKNQVKKRQRKKCIDIPVEKPEVKEKSPEKAIHVAATVVKFDPSLGRVHQKLLGKSPEMCSLCTWSFQTYDELKTHLLLHKLIIATDGSDAILKVSCLLCGKVFVTNKINKHMVLSHNKDVNFQRRRRKTEDETTKRLSLSQSVNALVGTGYECALCCASSNEDRSIEKCGSLGAYLKHFTDHHPNLHDLELVKFRVNSNPQIISELNEYTEATALLSIKTTALSDDKKKTSGGNRRKSTYEIGIPPPASMPYPHHCIVCGKGFYRRSQSSIHLKNAHPWFDEQNADMVAKFTSQNTTPSFVNLEKLPLPLFVEKKDGLTIVNDLDERTKECKKQKKDDSSASTPNETMDKITSLKESPTKPAGAFFDEDNSLKTKIENMLATKAKKKTNVIAKQKNRKIIRPGRPPSAFKNNQQQQQKQQIRDAVSPPSDDRQLIDSATNSNVASDAEVTSADDCVHMEIVGVEKKIDATGLDDHSAVEGAADGGVDGESDDKAIYSSSSTSSEIEEETEEEIVESSSDDDENEGDTKKCKKEKEDHFTKAKNSHKQKLVQSVSSKNLQEEPIQRVSSSNGLHEEEKNPIQTVSSESVLGDNNNTGNTDQVQVVTGNTDDTVADANETAKMKEPIPFSDKTKEGKGEEKVKGKPEGKLKDPLGLFSDDTQLNPNAVIVELDQDIPLLSPHNDIGDNNVAVTPNASIRIRSESNYYQGGKFVYSASIPPVSSGDVVAGGHFFTNYPLVCLFCGQGFYNRSKLKIHLTSKHVNCYTNELEKSNSFVNLDYPDVGACTGDVPDEPGAEDTPKPRRSRAKFEEVMRALKPVPRTIAKPSPIRKFPDKKNKGSSTSPNKPIAAGQKRKLAVKSSLVTSKSSSPKRKRGRPKSGTTLLKEKRKEVSTIEVSSPIKKRRQQETEDDDDDSNETESDSDSDSSVITTPTPIKSAKDDQSESSGGEDDKLSTSLENKYRCEWCDQMFGERKSMQNHIKRHFKGAKLNLLTCDACFCLVERHLLRRHMHQNHNDLALSQKRIWCEHCTYSVKKTAKKNFEKHIFEKHPSLLKIECRICDARFLTTSLYNQHFQATHGKSLDEQSMECLFCNKKFATLNKLYCHFSVVHMKKNEDFYCALCSKYFYGRTDLESHQDEFHKNDNYQCGLCLVDFDSAELCERHVMVHKRKSDFQCILCKFYFDSDVTLASHKSTHSDVVEDVLLFKCFTCEITFKSIEEFKLHLNSGDDDNGAKEDGVVNCDSTSLKATCLKCDLSFEDVQLFYDHSKSHIVASSTNDDGGSGPVEVAVDASAGGES